MYDSPRNRRRAVYAYRTADDKVKYGIIRYDKRGKYVRNVAGATDNGGCCCRAKPADEGNHAPRYYIYDE